MMYTMLDFLLNPLGLPIHALWQYLVIALLGYAAFFTGWDGRAQSAVGVLGHWLLRLTAFLILWAAGYGMIAAVQWLLAHWILAIVVLVGTALLVAALLAGCGHRAAPACGYCGG